ESGFVLRLSRCAIRRVFCMAQGRQYNNKKPQGSGRNSHSVVCSDYKSSISVIQRFMNDATSLASSFVALGRRLNLISPTSKVPPPDGSATIQGVPSAACLTVN